LARAILIPKNLIIPKWNDCLNNAPPEYKTAKDRHLIYCAERLESEFRSTPLKIAYRARDLKLIVEADCTHYFSNRIPI
jgi:hypothetical protein